MSKNTWRSFGNYGIIWAMETDRVVKHQLIRMHYIFADNNPSIYAIIFF